MALYYITSSPKCDFYYWAHPRASIGSKAAGKTRPDGPFMAFRIGIVVLTPPQEIVFRQMNDAKADKKSFDPESGIP